MNEEYREKLGVKLLANIQESSDGCWEWQGRIEPTGYATTRFNGDRFYAHRAAWLAFSGEIPDGKLILHKCDNRKCINPDHLFLGTQRDNMKDMIYKGRKVVVRGEKHGGAKLSIVQVLMVRCLHENGFKQVDIAKYLNLKKQRVNEIVNNKSWANEQDLL